MQSLSILILAGGRSTRMGRDKVWLELDGVPLVERVARRLLPVADEIIFSSNDPARFDSLAKQLPVPAFAVADRYQGVGPLAGLHAGLQAARCADLFAVAADMPLVDPSVVSALIGQAGDADAIVPLIAAAGSGEPQPEPLHAVYRKTCLPAIEAAIGRGAQRMVSFFDDVRVCYVSEAALRQIDPGLRSFRNLNTPAEWAAMCADPS